MTIGLAIYNELYGTAAVKALVGDRIHPAMAPEGEPSPYVVYALVSETAEHAFSGDASEVSAMYQISSFDEDYGDAKDVSDAIRTALTNFSGTMGGAGGVTVNRTKFMQEVNGGLDPQGEQYAVHLEFDITYTRS